MKKIALFMSLLITTEAFPTDGNDRLNYEIKSTEESIYRGAFYQNIENFSSDYTPPVVSDIVAYAFKVFGTISTGGSQQSLGENLIKFTEERLNEIDFSIFKTTKLSVDEFFAYSLQTHNKIEKIRDELKRIAPDSHHSNIEIATGKISRQFDQYRFAYLANHLQKNQEEAQRVASAMYKELASSVKEKNETIELNKKIESIEQLIQGLSAEQDKAKIKELQEQKILAQRLKKEIFRSQLQNVQQITDGLGAIISLSDSKAGEQIQTFGSSMVKIMDSLDNLSGEMGGIETIGQYANIATASITLLKTFGVFGKEKDGMAIALKALSKQIQRMQERVESRFDRLESQMFQYHKEIMKQFTIVNHRLDSLDNTLTDVYQRIVDIEKKMVETQIQIDLKTASQSLEQRLGLIDQNCLNGQAIQKAKDCLNQYQNFIQNDSSSLIFTTIGTYPQWNKFIDWQIHYYAQELGYTKKLANPSLLKEIKKRLFLLNQLNSQLNLSQTHEYQSLLKLINKKLDETFSFVSPEHVDQGIEVVIEHAKTVRQKVNNVLKQEISKSTLGSYFDELKAIKTELTRAIKEREFEIFQHQGKTEILARNYVKDLKTTIVILKHQLQTIISFEDDFSKRNWEEIINDQRFNFPIIIRPKNEVNGKARPFIMTYQELQKLHPYFRPTSFTAINAIKYEYDFDVFTHYVKKPSINDNSSYGTDGFSTFGSREYKYNGFVRNLKLTASINLLDENAIPVNYTFLDYTDNNSNCSGNLRRAAWYKSSVDPYSLPTLLQAGAYHHPVYNESCGKLFYEPNGSLVANSTQASWNLNQERESFKKANDNVKAQMKKSLSSKLNKGLSSNDLINACFGLELALNKLKGLIYLTYSKELDRDMDKVKSYGQIRSDEIHQSILTQAEYILNYEKGTLLLDMQKSINEWNSFSMGHVAN
jgi:hypothetical protein